MEKEIRKQLLHNACSKENRQLKLRLWFHACMMDDECFVCWNFGIEASLDFFCFLLSAFCFYFSPKQSRLFWSITAYSLNHSPLLKSWRRQKTEKFAYSLVHKRREGSIYFSQKTRKRLRVSSPLVGKSTHNSNSLSLGTWIPPIRDETMVAHSFSVFCLFVLYVFVKRQEEISCDRLGIYCIYKLYIFWVYNHTSNSANLLG